jgi:AcrR family transcriptional regulator
MDLIPEGGLRELCELYCGQGLSLAEVAARLGWSPSAVRARLVSLGIERRTPWAHNEVEASRELLFRLYVVEQLSMNAIAAQLGCPLSTVWRKLNAAGIASREAVKAPQHPRHDFSGDLAEMAHLTGFRIGDLHVALEGRTIVVKCTSTRPEQVELFRALFEPYGHVYTDEATVARRQRQSIGMQAALNRTFDFLLPKPERIPDWVLAQDETFFAFFAGYMDAEGYIRTYSRPGYRMLQAQVEIRSYDADLLDDLSKGLNARGIRCPPAALRVRAGYVNRYGVRSNRPLWGLGINRRDSMVKVFERIEPYLRHGRRRRDMFRALEALAGFGHGS